MKKTQPVSDTSSGEYETFDTEKFIINEYSNLSLDSYKGSYLILDRLCKKIDLVKAIYKSYEKDLSRARSSGVISDDNYVLLLKILIYYSKVEDDFKYLNSALKLYDLIINDYNRRSLEVIKNDLEELLNVCINIMTSRKSEKENKVNGNRLEGFVLDINVICYDNIPTRVYLAMLSKNGIKVKKATIIRWNNSRKYDLVAKFLGVRAANKLMSFKYLISRTLNEKNASLANLFLNKFNMTFDDLNCRIEKHASNVDVLYIKNLDDPELKQYIEDDTNETLLVSGLGGRVGSSLLDIENRRYLHVHPGIIPDVKGSDGLLWSYLVRGKVGYSCFYMNDGIDTGDILYTEEYAIHKIDNISLLTGTNGTLEYIKNYYDPLLRVFTLINYIKACALKNTTIEKTIPRKQNQSEGRVYFTMHKDLKSLVVKCITNKMKS